MHQCGRAFGRHGTQRLTDKRVFVGVAAVILPHALLWFAIFVYNACHQAFVGVFSSPFHIGHQCHGFCAHEEGLRVGGGFEFVANVIDGANAQVVR